MIYRQLGNARQLLIVPITFWSGLEQGFFAADFTAVRSLLILAIHETKANMLTVSHSRALSLVRLEFTQLGGC